VKRYRVEGESGLISSRRGQPSNNRLSEAIRQQSVKLLHANYADFGPTFAHEKLTEQHQLSLSVESVRQLLIQEGLWQSKTSRQVKRVYQRRQRRACYGELIQIDGSDHDWFEGRAPRCTLLVFIDDATGKLMHLRFVGAETTEAYLAALQIYLTRYGRPVAFYSDKHSVFRINLEEPVSGSGMTQFGRVLDSLDIEAIHAHSPQAKGRVERANSTLQDRLVKEMRLRDIHDWKTANAFLDEFMVDFNHRFAIEPRHDNDAHRGVQHTTEALALLFTCHYQRTISKSLEVQYDNQVYQIQVTGQGYRLRKTKVTICEAFDGTVTLLKDNKVLPYKLLKNGQKLSPLADEKTLNQRVDQSLKKQATHKARKPSPNHPWKKGFKLQQAATG
jgi:transposase InsO family protein